MGVGIFQHNGLAGLAVPHTAQSKTSEQKNILSHHTLKDKNLLFSQQRTLISSEKSFESY